jgi:BirA family transcriptional regulator, biotin operon repressor / biotin---[acetyl-CoA-carboxylase] ligase
MSNHRYQRHQIEQHLTTSALSLFPSIIHLQEVTSTNDYLLKLSQENSDNVICITERQTHGRGRRGQQWLSNDNDLCFSLLWRTTLSLEKLTGLSLVAGLAITEALEEFNIAPALQLKWPNDLFCNGKKLGGILIESTQLNNETAAIIGIGINNTQDDQKNNLPIPTTCLNDIASSPIDPNIIVASIVNKISEHLTPFSTLGLEPFLSSWKQYDLTFGRTITVHHNQKTISGTSHGINHKGELMISGENEETVNILSGRIELEEA